jgi:methionine-rich copper-binding protein CopC
MKRWSLAVAAAAALAAAAAQAHTALKSSSPAEGASAAAPVKEIVLEFGTDVRLTAVTLTAADGAKQAVGDVPATIAARFALPVRDELGPGQYVVTWRAVGGDTHVVAGEIRFTVTAPRSH